MIVYKVVTRHKLAAKWESCVQPQSDAGITYAVGKRASRKRGCGYLSVFTELDSAKLFAKAIGSIGNEYVAVMLCSCQLIKVSETEKVMWNAAKHSTASYCSLNLHAIRKRCLHLCNCNPYSIGFCKQLKPMSIIAVFDEGKEVPYESI